ncbi:PEP/pyruvate-binding domain-containing protein [Streptomyces sp. S.PNR 29]|uniref:PEP/pyruvate-binding domain-containing protein n=1 Tax=Streptomyces sp. S.PNR 29 TaxID=2973805 RepID=UPI0025B1E7B8|nr:PEP/pyruvate-binding domain-containing protein [Streptomyces sp. S.PNR 29]MDN0194909.1 PEP-utilizing enzyme [Streptomyces sp. S.PNR 29]
MTTLDERRGEGARDGRGPRDAASRPVGTHGPAAVPLDQPAAVLPRLAGSKAANLARAARAGLPVLPGFVIPQGSADAAVPRRGRPDRAGDGSTALRQAWQELSDGGTRPLVVRSSSPQEDTEESSLAGRFVSVLDVRGWQDFRTAVHAVLDSAHRPDGSTAPMAVLVQPMLAARAGGVMFGADPVEGRADRMLVSAVHGGPDSLVSGAQAGTSYWLGRSGRLLRTEPPEPDGLLGRAELLRLARLARRVRRVFGGPQDIEFGFDAEGRLWLFQSRPITAMAARPPRGARLLGPGPVAETLPEQLQPLEEDLWVAPMARGLAAVLDIGGSAPRRLLRTVPVITTVGGRPAADLRLLGAVPPSHRWLALLNPAPAARRLAASWRLGRLTAALPGLARDLTADIDRRLAEIPPPARLSGSDLAATLRWTRTALVSLHAQESLAGSLLPEPPQGRTAAGAALTALAQARARGVPDERAVADAPLILALTAPSLRGRGRLPQNLAPGPAGTGADRGRMAAEPEQAPTTTGPDQETATAHHGPATTTHHGPATTTHHGPTTTPPPGTPTPQGHGRPASAGASDHGTAATVVVAPHVFPAPALPPREALRLRIRWVHELQVRLVREAARRHGVDAQRAGMLRWPELLAVLGGGALPAGLDERVPAVASPPLPDAFRLADGGVVVAERTGRTRDGARGVSGGRAVGIAWDGTGHRPADAVLVVRTLDPALAPLLPGLTGLVAQTGSPLSHLAVLARECGVPAVVGATNAVRRFPPGTRLTLDGSTGQVQRGDAP